MSLTTPTKTVEKLQISLQTKAKTEPAYRFYSLWDKICREDVLLEAYCRCRANAGAAGVDGETFVRIENQDQKHWLETLREELVSGEYAPKPLLRVWIPKSNGGQRPLGILTIRDRVVQMAFSSFSFVTPGSLRNRSRIFAGDNPFSRASSWAL